MGCSAGTKLSRDNSYYKNNKPSNINLIENKFEENSKNNYINNKNHAHQESNISGGFYKSVINKSTINSNTNTNKPDILTLLQNNYSNSEIKRDPYDIYNSVIYYFQFYSNIRDTIDIFEIKNLINSYLDIVYAYNKDIMINNKNAIINYLSEIYKNSQDTEMSYLINNKNNSNDISLFQLFIPNIEFNSGFKLNNNKKIVHNNGFFLVINNNNIPFNYNNNSNILANNDNFNIKYKLFDLIDKLNTDVIGRYNNINKYGYLDSIVKQVSFNKGDKYISSNISLYNLVKRKKEEVSIVSNNKANDNTKTITITNITILIIFDYLSHTAITKLLELKDVINKFNNTSNTNNSSANISIYPILNSFINSTNTEDINFNISYLENISLIPELLNIYLFFNNNNSELFYNKMTNIVDSLGLDKLISSKMIVLNDNVIKMVFDDIEKLSEDFFEKTILEKLFGNDSECEGGNIINGKLNCFFSHSSAIKNVNSNTNFKENDNSLFYSYLKEISDYDCFDFEIDVIEVFNKKSKRDSNFNDSNLSNMSDSNSRVSSSHTISNNTNKIITQTRRKQKEANMENKINSKSSNNIFFILINNTYSKQDKQVINKVSNKIREILSISNTNADSIILFNNKQVKDNKEEELISKIRKILKNNSTLQNQDYNIIKQSNYSNSINKKEEFIISVLLNNENSKNTNNDNSSDIITSIIKNLAFSLYTNPLLLSDINNTNNSSNYVIKFNAYPKSKCFYYNSIKGLLNNNNDCVMIEFKDTNTNKDITNKDNKLCLSNKTHIVFVYIHYSELGISNTNSYNNAKDSNGMVNSSNKSSTDKLNSLYYYLNVIKQYYNNNGNSSNNEKTKDIKFDFVFIILGNSITTLQYYLLKLDLFYSSLNDQSIFIGGFKNVLFSNCVDYDDYSKFGFYSDSFSIAINVIVREDSSNDCKTNNNNDFVSYCFEEFNKEEFDWLDDKLSDLLNENKKIDNNSSNKEVRISSSRRKRRNDIGDSNSSNFDDTTKLSFDSFVNLISNISNNDSIIPEIHYNNLFSFIKTNFNIKINNNENSKNNNYINNNENCISTLITLRTKTIIDKNNNTTNSTNNNINSSNRITSVLINLTHSNQSKNINHVKQQLLNFPKINSNKNMIFMQNLIFETKCLIKVTAKCGLCGKHLFSEFKKQYCFYICVYNCDFYLCLSCGNDYPMNMYLLPSNTETNDNKKTKKNENSNKNKILDFIVDDNIDDFEFPPFMLEESNEIKDIKDVNITISNKNNSINNNNKSLGKSKTNLRYDEDDSKFTNNALITSKELSNIKSKLNNTTGTSNTLDVANKAVDSSTCLNLNNLSHTLLYIKTNLENINSNSILFNSTLLEQNCLSNFTPSAFKCSSCGEYVYLSNNDDKLFILLSTLNTKDKIHICIECFELLNNYFIIRNNISISNDGYLDKDKEINENKECSKIKQEIYKKIVNETIIEIILTDTYNFVMLRKEKSDL